MRVHCCFLDRHSGHLVHQAGFAINAESIEPVKSLEFRTFLPAKPKLSRRPGIHSSDPATLWNGTVMAHDLHRDTA